MWRPKNSLQVCITHIAFICVGVIQCSLYNLTKGFTDICERFSEIDRGDSFGFCYICEAIFIIQDRVTAQTLTTKLPAAAAPEDRDAMTDRDMIDSFTNTRNKS